MGRRRLTKLERALYYLQNPDAYKRHVEQVHAENKRKYDYYMNHPDWEVFGSGPQDWKAYHVIAHAEQIAERKKREQSIKAQKVKEELRVAIVKEKRNNPVKFLIEELIEVDGIETISKPAIRQKMDSLNIPFSPELLKNAIKALEAEGVTIN